MWTAINFVKFNAEVTGMICVAGGEMFGGGTYSEYGTADERSASYRYERKADGSEVWYCWA
jgi:hypothetical protein